jgi:putative oxidoreductase
MSGNVLLYLIKTAASAWIIFIRLSLALIFIPEGIQKLIHPEALGAGRFLKMGIPYPEFTVPFVGWVEIICGSLILFGLLTRLAALPLIITMIVAMIATKLPILMGHDWVVTDTMIFYVRELKAYGFWSFMHESRTDWAMLMCGLYLLAVGGGKCSLDRQIQEQLKNNSY